MRSEFIGVRREAWREMCLPLIDQPLGAASALRPLDMRNMVAMSILVTGFAPSLESRLSAAAIFGGSAQSAEQVAPVAALAVSSIGAPIAVAGQTGFLSRLAYWRSGR